MSQTPADTTPTSTGADTGDSTADADLRRVRVDRIAEKHYVATSASGATLEFGSGAGLLSPVELLLAALGGCSAVDVDVVTSRRSQPDRFAADVTARRVVDADGGVRLDDLAVDFHIVFPDDESGRQAARLVPRLVRMSHDKDCTVSRTLEHPNRVELRTS